MAIVLPKFSRRRTPTGLSAETQPAVNVALCRLDGCYPAGGSLAAKWRVRRVPLERMLGLEVSVLWHTEGKGDDDLHVHHFRRLGMEQLRSVDPELEQVLECQLPASPLSYHGKLITIRWCIRLRLFIDDGREIVAEQPFHLVAQDFRPACEGSELNHAPLPVPDRRLHSSGVEASAGADYSGWRAEGESCGVSADAIEGKESEAAVRGSGLQAALRRRFRVVASVSSGD